MVDGKVLVQDGLTLDGAIMRMYAYCRAVVAREKASVIRSGKVAMLVDTGSPFSGWTERT